MADYNRNQRDSNRSSNQDWNDNRNRNGRNSGDRNNTWENRGNQGFDEGNAAYQSRYQREDFNRGGGYSSGGHGRHFESDFNSGNYGGDRGSGYASYYGSDSYYGSGVGYGTGSGNSQRNLYDRDYEGSNRGGYSNSGTRLGGANYGNYGDRGRTWQESKDESRNGGFGRQNYGSENQYRGQEDRNWFDKASDEVSSWFGDDEAERRRDRDKQMSGQHRGKGPKNYSRTDERIKEDINDRLSDDPFIDASDIDVTVNSGEVTLTGTVDERSAKRRAEDLAEAVSGVKNVENRIRVGKSSISGMGGSAMTEGRNTESQSESTQTTSGVAGSERSRSKNYVTG
jgi:osmotically-inducible protein OsmY